MAQQTELPRIQEQPHALFNHSAEASVLKNLTNEVEAHNVLSAPLNPMLKKRLAWYPLLTAEMIKDGSLGVADIKDILRSPEITCSILLQDYTSLASRLEPLIYKDPASIRRILRDRRYCGQPTLLPIEDYLKKLEGDPFRHYEALQDPALQSKVLPSLRTQSEAAPEASASWSYIYIATHAISEVSESLGKSLARDQELLFRAVLLLRRSRNLPESVWDPLLELIDQPKWAFHAIAHNTQSRKQEDRLLDIIHSSPPWLADYWAATQLPQKAINASYIKAAQLSCRHECVSELHFHYRWRIAQMQPDAALVALAKNR